jgi:signal transduction histidine kinase
MHLIHQHRLDAADTGSDARLLHTADPPPNPLGNVTYLHDKLRAACNRSRDQVVGQDDRILNSGDHPKHCFFDLWASIAQDKVWKGEIRIRANDGAFYSVESTIIPFLSADGSPQYVLIRAEITERAPRGELIGARRHNALSVVSYSGSTFHDRDRVLQSVFAAARDVAERKGFEDALQQQNIELQTASRKKSELLVNMSRELRSRLNSISGCSEVLKDGVAGQITAQQRERANNMFELGQHMLLLAIDMLDLSKVEIGNMRLELEAVGVASLCASRLSIISEQAASRHIRHEIDAVELGSIQADLRKCRQILYNLLSNAVKFTNQAGLAVGRQ